MTKKKSTSSTPKCANCKREAELFSGIKNNKLYENLCESCIGVFGSAEFSREYDRRFQRREYAKDIIQPSDKEAYIKAYPDNARQYYSDEEIRRYS